MIPLVNKAVSTVKNAEWISVEVSSQLPGLVEELKKEMAKRQGSVVPEILSLVLVRGRLVGLCPGLTPQPSRIGLGLFQDLIPLVVGVLQNFLGHLFRVRPCSLLILA